MTKRQKVVAIAKKIAKTIPNFYKSVGPGKGNRRANLYMEKLREQVKRLRGIECEKHFDKEINSAFDFYIKDEKTVIEIALSLRNPLSEFHKDVFKVLLAKDNRMKINRLVFLSKDGALKRQKEPQYQAIRRWLKKYYTVEVKIEELCGR